MTTLELFLLIIGVLILLLIGWPIFFMGAPFLPSFRKKDKVDFNKLFKILKDNNVDKVIDIGSGDGRLVKKLSQAGFKSHGIEINPLLFLLSHYKLRNLKSKNTLIYRGNFWKKDLSDYDAIFMFHFKTANKKLIEKFKRELKNESLIISTGFKLDDFELVDKISPFYIHRFNKK
ncbi:MAG: class I SAM-dependent methyltransferase [Candidatus Paceibacterota bacterium]